MFTIRKQGTTTTHKINITIIRCVWSNAFFGIVKDFNGYELVLYLKEMSLYFDYKNGVYYRYNVDKKKFVLVKIMNKKTFLKIKSNPQRYDMFDKDLVDSSTDSSDASSHEDFKSECKFASD